MARTLNLKTVRLYRTVVRKLVKPTYANAEPYWSTTVYGPYDTKNVNQNYDWDRWRADSKDGEYQVVKQELKPVFNLTEHSGLVLGLEWISYEVDGEKVDHHV